MSKLDNMLFYIIIILPLLDILTAFTTTAPVSIGAVFRVLLMVFLSMYLFWYLAANHPFYFKLFILACLTIAITFGVAFLSKQPFYLREEIQFTFKTAYYMMMLFTILVLIEKQIQKAMMLRATTYAALIIGVSYWLAFLTKTNIKSYAYLKMGYAGWFFSANELSVIVLILFACTIVSLHTQANGRSLVAFILLLSMLPMIGTKTAFYGGALLLIADVLYILFTPRKSWDMTVLTVSLLFIITLPLTPIMSNAQAGAFLEGVEQTSTKENLQPLLSSRDVYLKTTMNDYKQAPIQQKLFGLGYAGNYQAAPKTIEMDFYDLFFSYGIIGTIILLLPFLLIGDRIFFIKRSFTYLLLLLTIALCIGIAFVAGHVLFAPAVMSYVVILAVLVNLEARSV